MAERPFVLIVGGEHGSFAGIAGHVPDGCQVIHAPDIEEAHAILDDCATPGERDYRSDTLAAFGMELRLIDHELHVAGRMKYLGRTAFYLAWEFMADPGNWLTGAHLLEAVWEDPGRRDTGALRQGVADLRRTLAQMDAPACIETGDVAGQTVSSGSDSPLTASPEILSLTPLVSYRFEATAVDSLGSRSQGAVGGWFSLPGNEDPDPLATDAARAAIDLDMSEADALQALELQDTVVDMGDYLDAESAAFGGMYITHEPYSITVLSEPGDAQQLLQDLAEFPEWSALDQDTYVVETTRTEGNLEAQLDDVRVLIPDSNGYDIDIEAGSVLVWMDDQDGVDEAEAVLAGPGGQRAPTYSNVDVAVGVDAKPLIKLQGGHKSGGGCTTGFSATDPGTGLDFITTAGHCANYPKYGGANGVPLYTSVEAFTGSVDVQGMRCSDDPCSMTNKIVIDDDQHVRTITSKKPRSSVRVGMILCKYGVFGGPACGVVKSRSFDPTHLYRNEPCDPCTFNKTWLRIAPKNPDVVLAIDGDSGGPWFKGNTAYGFTSGGWGRCDPDSGSGTCTRAGQAVVMPQNYTQALDMVVKTAP